MRSSDVEAATAVILKADWGDRRTWFEFATSQPECQPVVAIAEGEVVGTGVGTANGLVGWVGTIWVAPDRRGAGLGRALTEAVIDRLESAGCTSLLLVATAEGRRLYERMGFELQTTYRILEAPGLAEDAAAPDASGVVRPFDSNDFEVLVALDAAATGEDRGHLLRRFANPSSTKVARDRESRIRGFVVRAAWGGGATIADSDDVAMAILTARRLASGPTGRIRVGLVAENVHGLAALERAGLHTVWSAPRMSRGAALTWRPDWIWGQFNHALG